MWLQMSKQANAAILALTDGSSANAGGEPIDASGDGFEERKVSPDQRAGAALSLPAIPTHSRQESLQPGAEGIADQHTTAPGVVVRIESSSSDHLLESDANTTELQPLHDSSSSAALSPSAQPAGLNRTSSSTPEVEMTDIDAVNAAEWDEYVTDDGLKYYFNKTTGVSTWENPIKRRAV